MKRRFAAFAIGLALTGGPALAAELRIRNLDEGTARGLNDPAPAAPVGGNPGRTRGEQARIVMEFAASLWGAVLKSPVPIDIDASFGALKCDASSGFVGYANALSGFLPERDMKGFSAGVWYHIALANALSGKDLDPGKSDLKMEFNGNLGAKGCIEGSQWYFGLDSNTPAGNENLLDTVLHEMAHGLGFAEFGDLQTGRLAAGDDGVAHSDVYSLHVYDNAKGKHWQDMTDQERIGSAVNDGHLVFDGPYVKAHAPLALVKRDALEVTTPDARTRDYTFAPARFGPAAGPANFSGSAVRVVTGRNAQACTTLDNAAAVAGHVALIDAGYCTFQTQARFAAAAGASAAIIVIDGDIIPSSLLSDGGSPVAIPVVAISRNDGAELKENVASANIRVHSILAGTDGAGNVQIYAPRTLEAGSSFAHFDYRLSPDALMEPSGGGSLGHIDLDLTPSLFMDEGWGVNDGGQPLGSCNTGVPTWVPGGVIVGANIVATARVLASTSATVGEYGAGMRAHADKLARDGLLSVAQASSLNACLSDTELARQYESWRYGSIVVPAVRALESGKLLAGVDGATGSERTYTLEVPAGARTLNIRTFGGTGDVSLLVKLDEEPTAVSYHARSVHPGNSESVIRARPAAGTYFIKVVGAGAYAGLNVQATYSK